MNILNEWIRWRIYRPRGAFRGWWNMSEEEMVKVSYKRKIKLARAIIAAISVSRFPMSVKFYEMLANELENGREKSVSIGTKLKKDLG